MTTPVYLEQGERAVFAVSLDWPGWCRRGTSAAEALDALARVRSRYELIAGEIVPLEGFEVVGTIAGDATTDFGAPSALGPWDQHPLRAEVRAKHRRLLADAWRALDAAALRSAPVLTKGPRGGGRDRDAVLQHVREAERAYASKVGLRVPPRTPWADQRETLLAHLATDPVDARWPIDYAVRRIAWHVVDHVWEIEDRQPANEA